MGLDEVDREIEGKSSKDESLSISFMKEISS